MSVFHEVWYLLESKYVESFSFETWPFACVWIFFSPSVVATFLTPPWQGKWVVLFHFCLVEAEVQVPDLATISTQSQITPGLKCEFWFPAERVAEVTSLPLDEVVRVQRGLFPRPFPASAWVRRGDASFLPSAGGSTGSLFFLHWHCQSVYVTRRQGWNSWLSA